MSLRSAPAFIGQSLSQFYVSKVVEVVTRCVLKAGILVVLHSAAIYAIILNWKTTEDEDDKARQLSSASSKIQITKHSQSVTSYPFSAIRTEFKITGDVLATIFTPAGTFRWLPAGIRPHPGGGLLAAVAPNKRLPLFDSEYRNKKQAEIVVRALVIGLMQAANRASAWILIQNFYFG
jgi:hypothetical protein